MIEEIGAWNFPEKPRFQGQRVSISPAATSNGIWTFPGTPRFHGPRFSIFPAATPISGLFEVKLLRQLGRKLRRRKDL